MNSKSSTFFGAACCSNNPGRIVRLAAARLAYFSCSLCFRDTKRPAEKAGLAARPSLFAGAERRGLTRKQIPSLKIRQVSASVFCLLAGYYQRRRLTTNITARPRLLSVTESFTLPPQPKQAVIVSQSRQFSLREWLVPPILLPVFLGLLVAAAMVIQW